MRNALKITKKNILKLKEELGWEGEGTSSNPVIINSIGVYPSTINQYRTNQFIRIKNLNRITLNLYSCKNCVIEQNSIYYLKLYNCEQTIVENNTILELETHYGGGNSFKRNRMSQETHTNLINRFYEKRIHKLFNFGFWVLLSLFITLMLRATFDKRYLYSLIVLIPLITFAGFYVSMQIHKHKSKTLPETVIEDNEIIDSKQLINELL